MVNKDVYIILCDTRRRRLVMTSAMAATSKLQVSPATGRRALQRRRSDDVKNMAAIFKGEWIQAARYRCSAFLSVAMPTVRPRSAGRPVPPATHDGYPPDE